MDGRVFHAGLVHLVGVVADLFAVDPDDLGRDAHGGGVLRHVLDHHRAGGDAGVVVDGDGPQDLGPGADHHVVADGGVALAQLLAGAPQGHPLVEQHVVPDLRGLADDKAVAVVDHQAAADGGAGVDLDAGPEPAPLGDAPGQKTEAAAVEAVGQAGGIKSRGRRHRGGRSPACRGRRGSRRW